MKLEQDDTVMVDIEFCTVLVHFSMYDHCLYAKLSPNSYLPRHISNCFYFYSSYDVGFLSSSLSFWLRCCMCVAMQLDSLRQCCLLLCLFLMILSYVRLNLKQIFLSSFKNGLRGETNTFQSRSYYISYFSNSCHSHCHSYQSPFDLFMLLYM